jgi:hypothetical protein
MRLIAARVQKYRSIRDTGWFDLEADKSIMVGANEAGKTVLLRALQQLNAPEGVAGFEALRDYPRSEYQDITTGVVDPEDVVVVSGRFALDHDDLQQLPEGYEGTTYLREVRLNNATSHRLEGAPERLSWDTGRQKAFARMAHLDKQAAEGDEISSTALASITDGWRVPSWLMADRAKLLAEWLDANATLVDETNTTEDNRHTRLVDEMRLPAEREQAVKTLRSRLPTFVLFNNYFRVRPSIHLARVSGFSGR